MKSVIYLEEDVFAGLLRDYFIGGRNTYLVRSPSLERSLRAEGIDAVRVRDGRLDFEAGDAADADLILVQSDDAEHLTQVLQSVVESGVRVPVLVLTSREDAVPEPYRSFAFCISLNHLLESNLRWHVRLAQTMRRLESARLHFESAKNVLILLQDDPDPDAIASGLALRHVLGRNRSTAAIGSFGRVTRPENIAMVEVLDLKIERLTPSKLLDFDRIAMVDSQPTHLRRPLRYVDLVIDHHPEQTDYSSPLRDIRPGYGATSTILLEYLRCARLVPSERLATAMLYGIKSDTFLLAREVNEFDVEAFSYLYPRANQSLMRRIERPQLPPGAIDALSYALKNRRLIDRVAFVHLGAVEREDLIPQMADFCLQFEGVDWSAVSGIHDSNFILSVRNVGYVRAAGKVVKDAFGDVGSAGGHASMAKAVIPLSELSRKWNIDVRNARVLSRRIQKEFLKSLRGA